MELLLILLLFGASEALAQSAASRVHVDMALVWQLMLFALWAMIGGAVSFYQKVKKKAARWMNIGELVGEMATSAFAGLVTGFLFDGLGANPMVTFAAVGVAGHAGGRALFWIEQKAQAWADAKINAISPVSAPEEGKSE
jgi:hypothetical protein